MINSSISLLFRLLIKFVVRKIQSDGEIIFQLILYKAYLSLISHFREKKYVGRHSLRWITMRFHRVGIKEDRQSDEYATWVAALLPGENK